jgi:hypothetical protein
MTAWVLIVGLCIPIHFPNDTPSVGRCFFTPELWTTHADCKAEERKRKTSHNVNIVAHDCFEVQVHDPDGQVTQDLGLGHKT